jgi:hypothetical protein
MKLLESDSIQRDLITNNKNNNNSKDMIIMNYNNYIL